MAGQIRSEVTGNLVLARRGARYKQSDIAEFLGVSTKSVSDWECGRTDPGFDTLDKLGEFYGLTGGGLWFFQNHSKDRPVPVQSQPAATLANQEPMSAARMQSIIMRLAARTGLDVGALLTGGQVAPDFSKISSQAVRSHQASRRQRQPKAS